MIRGLLGGGDYRIIGGLWVIRGLLGSVGDYRIIGGCG